MDLNCNLCGHTTPLDELETAPVRSNVRAFRSESFVYDRCSHCASLHARDGVDLAYYYSKYPYHDLPDDWSLRAMYKNYLARLRRAGLKPTDTILDYGCGGGQFVQYLQSQGYEARGFDEYSEGFGDRSVLADRYDCIVAQDVIEHLPDPHAFLAELGGLVKPGGLVAIGTPEATSVDLSKSDAFQHVVHAPYHRHILSRQALVDAGGQQGWELARYYPTHYSHTAWPFLNERFYLYYTNLRDGSIDSLLEPLSAGALLSHLPQTLFWGLFGRMMSRNTDVMALFHVPHESPTEAQPGAAVQERPLDAAN